MHALHIIYVIPPRGYGKERLFDLTNKRLNRDDSQLVFVKLKDELLLRGYVVSTRKKYAKKADIVVCFNLPDPCSSQWNEVQQLSKQRKRMIAFIFEPVVAQPWIYDKKMHALFDRIYTLEDDLVDNKKYFKFFYPQPSLLISEDILPFSQKKLLTLIAKNKQARLNNVSGTKELYSERCRALDFFNQFPQDFSFYGGGWSSEKYRTYGGGIDQKVEILKKFKFCLCYENSSVNGYITEKIFDCMIAGCVPIYWGAPNISRYIPSDCYIQREKFRSNQQLYDFITHMSEHEYHRYRQAITNFMRSDQSVYFSIESFVALFIQHALKM